MKQSTLKYVILGLAIWGAVSSAQSVMPAPKFTAYDANGDPCSSCRLYAYAAGTTTPQDTFTSYDLGTPNANPVVLDSAGRATVFLNSAQSYKFTLKTAADVDIWTVDNVTGQLSGVVTISAANARGLVITRASADAGMSIASTGGSGDTYAIVSTTAGELRIQDDTDGSPRFQLGAGEAASVVTTGTFTVDGGLLSVTGFGTHSVSGAGTGANLLEVRNTTSGTGNAGQIRIGNNTAADGLKLTNTSSAYTPSGAYLASAGVIQATQAGGLSIDASDSAGDIRFYTGGSSTPAMTIDQDGIVTAAAFASTAALPGTGTTNDYAIGRASLMLYNSGVGDATITGITGGVQGRMIWAVTSPNSTGNLILAHQSASSTAANRIVSSSGVDITVTTTDLVLLIYDGNSSRWLAFDLK